MPSPLADILVALTDPAHVMGELREGLFHPAPDMTVTAAWEMLETRGLAPPPSDARVFQCRSCDGTGSDMETRIVGRGPCPDCTPLCPACDGSGEVLPAYSADHTVPCDDCGGTGFASRYGIGHRPEPSSLRDLALWASYDVATAEALAREAVLGCTRILWAFKVIPVPSAGEDERGAPADIRRLGIDYRWAILDGEVTLTIPERAP